jgi:hypothetical protein
MPVLLPPGAVADNVGLGTSLAMSGHGFVFAPDSLLTVTVEAGGDGDEIHRRSSTTAAPASDAALIAAGYATITPLNAVCEAGAVKLPEFASRSGGG